MTPAGAVSTAAGPLGLALGLLLALRLISLQRFAQTLAGGGIGLAVAGLPEFLDVGHG